MIQIDESYFIDPTGMSWNLHKKEKTGEINPETGKEIISTDIWYCSSLSRALLRYTNEASKKAESIRGLQKILEKINETIAKVGQLPTVKTRGLV